MLQEGYTNTQGTEELATQQMKADEAFLVEAVSILSVGSATVARLSSSSSNHT